MAQNEKLVDVLNDLIEINNDRVVGYQKAVEESKDSDVDLIATYNKLADDSRGYAAELRQVVQRLGGEPVQDGTTNKGKIYRVWMDIRAAFAGHDRHSVLANNEYGEDAAQKAYNEALESDAEMPADIRQLITEQKSQLKEAHDMIKKYRDAEAAVS
jgi:uncharacterized protein (TIGR02284 family)